MNARSQDVPSRLFLAIGRLSRSLRQTGTVGPGHGAISAMATLAGCGQLRLGDLAIKEGVAAPTMSRVVAALVEAGYVTREPDPVDRRAWLATLTEEGEQLLAGLHSTKVHKLGLRVDQLGPEHREALMAALPALEALVSDTTE